MRKHKKMYVVYTYIFQFFFGYFSFASIEMVAKQKFGVNQLLCDMHCIIISQDTHFYSA